MNFIKIAGRDISSIFKNRFIRVSVTAIIIVPLLYSLLYLYAFWDPYSKLAQMPVAVVNLDKGTIKDGEGVNYGKDLVDKLENNEKVGWRFVPKDDAENGVKKNDYYAMFVIPEDFSEKILSAKNGKPEEPRILYTANEKKNFLAAQINGKVLVELKSELIKNITDEYTKVAFDSLYEVKDGMNTAAEGSNKITDGIGQAKDGAAQLYFGADSLNSAIGTVNEGMSNLSSGLLAAKDGSEALDSGAGKLQDGLKQMGSGISALNDAVSKDTQTGISLSTGVKSLYDGITNPDPTKGLSAGIAALNNAVNIGDDHHPSLAAGVSKLNDGVANRLAPGLNSLNTAVSTKLSPSVSNISAATSHLNDLVSIYNSADSSEQQKAAALQEILLTIPQLNSGAAQLNASVNQTTSASSPSLKDSVAALNAAVNIDSDPLNPSLKTGMSMLYNSITAPQTGLADGVKALNTAVNIGTDAQHPSLVYGITAVNNGVNIGTQDKPGLVDAAAQLNYFMNIGSKNQPSILSGISQLKAGTAQLVPGTASAAEGANKLFEGTKQLFDGSQQLRNAIAKPEEVKNISEKETSSDSTLFNGESQLYDGSKELSDKLQEGFDKLNKNLVNDSKTMGQFVSEPLVIDERPINPVKNYGTGFTPYFVPLSLWVGALMMFFVITDKIDDDINAGPASIVLGKFLSYGYIGIIQAVLASSIVLLLGLKPDNIILYYLFNILLSFVFIAIIQSLVFLLGEAGRLLSIILLILQLTACAGTFPLEVVPSFFKIINPFMPFTYAVSGLREVISGLDYSVFIRDVTILGSIMLVFLIISIIMKGHADKVKDKIRQVKNGISIT